jgi:hypothetical protein
MHRSKHLWCLKRCKKASKAQGSKAQGSKAQGSKAKGLAFGFALQLR